MRLVFALTLMIIAIFAASTGQVTVTGVEPPAIALTAG